MRLRRLAHPDGRRAALNAARAAFWLAIGHAVLRVRPYSAVRELIGNVTPRRHRVRPMSAAEAEVAIRRASRALGIHNCLSRAIAAAVLLRRDGVDSVLTIGVGFDDRRRFEAHAWLDAGGRIVCGAAESADREVLLRDAISCRSRVASRPALDRATETQLS